MLIVDFYLRLFKLKIREMGKFQSEEKMAKGGKRPICIVFSVFLLISVVLLALTVYFATKPSDCKGICGLRIFDRWTDYFILSELCIVTSCLQRAHS